ncbi:uncharacterized protein LOC116212304 [Punica granatum]|uniref:GIR1-like zinc ribbon domain-containing protein n=2 Tax=Punica granatum TaxID=22663 RepID=A0A218W820_PUNGR|nr:uncharacterized protein LOC116212304 [Punica granatum]OWM69027.1 hypothetical protein CDL15_Pgr025214 [Punica granatum]PKI73382.1 hypothetical protein CRG98_006320 [Punica granatum]
MMSTKRANSPQLELKLNLSPPRSNGREGVLETLEYTSPPSSHESSCFSCGPTAADHQATTKANSFGYSSSLESTAVTSMVLVGCPRCLMYVMLSEVSPKCPRCKSTVLLGFLNTELHGSKKSTN